MDGLFLKNKIDIKKNKKAKMFPLMILYLLSSVYNLNYFNLKNKIRFWRYPFKTLFPSN